MFVILMLSAAEFRLLPLLITARHKLDFLIVVPSDQFDRLAHGSCTFRVGAINDNMSLWSVLLLKGSELLGRRSLWKRNCLRYMTSVVGSFRPGIDQYNLSRC